MILFSLITLNYTHIAYIIIEFNYFEKRERKRDLGILEDWRRLGRGILGRGILGSGSSNPRWEREFEEVGTKDF